MRRTAIMLGALVAGCGSSFALNPSLDISQYGHTAWTARDGFSMGAIFAMAQTPDGYLWLASEFGLFRFDGIHAVPWQPPAGQQLPAKPYALLVTRDGTLWIGTFAGLVSWNGSKLTRYPEVGEYFVTSLLQDREGTVWAGIHGSTTDIPTGRLCGIRSGRTQCYLQDGAFGTFVWSLSEDGSGTLWVGAESEVWRWKPGPPKRYAMAGMRIGDLVKSDDGRLLIGISGAGLRRLGADKLESYPIHRAMNRNALLSDREVDSNKLLRDRDGGLWIGTRQRGLIHIHNGRTDVFTKSDGLSGDIGCSLFEDREGNVWFASSGGLDRFRELPVTTISTKQGLSSDYASSLVAGTDGYIWVGTRDGLTRWSNGQSTIFRKANGLPADFVQSLFEDSRGRVWATFSGHGLSYFKDGGFVSIPGAPREEVYSIAGDDKDNLWLSWGKGLSHMRGGRFVETFPWSAMGRHQQAKVVVPDQGGVWLAFWIGGGVLYFKDGQVRASYTAAAGLGKGPVQGLRLDRDGAVWAATQEGGLSRIKDGHVATLTTRNGLPCDTIHWTMEDDDRAFWLYTACGMVRITRTELDAWIADPNRWVQTTVWDAADGVRVGAVSPAYFNPPVAKSSDGKLWFITGEGIQVLDPRHLAFNRVPPPVHIEQVKADGKPYQLKQGMHLPANVRDVSIYYTALSMVAPEKVRFKYMLEGQDPGWREVINDRDVQYSNLPPRKYRFRLIACNNSGVWNETGDTLEFTIEPRFYQTAWFGGSCAVAFLAMLWGLHRLRLYQLAREFNARLEERVGERTRIARELHDTLLQSFQGLMFSFQAARNLLPGRTEEAIRTLDGAIREGDEAIAEGRDAIQGLRADPALESNLEQMLTAAGKELARSSSGEGEPPAFEVTVEGARQPLSPVLQDEVYRMAREILRNAFHHAHASRIEAEIAYDLQFFRLRIRDDGKGIDRQVFEQGARQGHWGLPGVRERAKRIGARLKLWSEPGAGTEAELTVPAPIAYRTAQRREGWRLFRKRKVQS